MSSPLDPNVKPWHRPDRWPKIFDLAPSWLKVPVTLAMLDGTQQDTGVALPRNAMVIDVFLKTRTVEATAVTKTVKVGFTGDDEASYIDGLSVGSGQDGWQRPSVVDPSTYGTWFLLEQQTAGGDPVNVARPIMPGDPNDDPGSVSVTSSEQFHEADFDIWFLYLNMPDDDLPSPF